MIRPELWTRNSFDVGAVRITEENIREVATWCGGTVAKTLTDNPKLYVCVGTKVHNQLRDTKAHIGDWIINVDGEYKHYRDRQFRQAYQSKAAKREAVLEMVREAMSAQEEEDWGFDKDRMIENTTDKIMEFFEEG